MKKVIYLIATLLVSLSCGTEEVKPDEKPEEIVILSVDDQFEALAEMDRKLLTADLSIDTKVSKQLYAAANLFASENPSHERAADALELAAKGAEGIGKYNDAINILHKIITDYPETEKTPMFMYRKAIILEEKMGKPDNARAAYQALIARFPNDLLSISAQEYLDMDYLNMSDAEVIQFLESKNQEVE
jgi:tetratricopeptide (TPR) repeat protein